MTKTNKHNTIINAWLAMFPGRKSFSEFKTDILKIADGASGMAKTIPRILQYAQNQGVIRSASETDFTTFIENGTKTVNQKGEPVKEGYVFRDLLEEVTKNSSVNHLVNALNEITRQFGMPAVQASMFTRLKQDFNPNTAIKRNCLRILAYWLGLNRPLDGWNYEKLIALQKHQVSDIDTEAGVRIAFKIEGKGDIINPDAVAWLKEELKQCMKTLKLYHVNRKEPFDYSSATVFLNIYKKPGVLGEPRLYNWAIRDAMALAHQIVVRWDLYCVRQKLQNALLIGVAAGRYHHLDTQIHALLAVKLPANHFIRLTSFAHLCSRIADIKVVFFKDSKDVELPGGNVITVWSVDCFWVFIYYDFIPDLLNEEMLPVYKGSESYDEFRNALYFAKDIKHKALSAMYQYPHNTLLILEIAKVCAARKMFHEANAILSTLLASEPQHVVARTFRMFIYLNMAVEQTDFEICELHFERAIDEGLYIMKQCVVEEEDFFCEFGLVYIGIALRIFIILRNGKIIQDKEKDIERSLSYLRKAENIFKAGRTVSETGIGNRTVYWLLNTNCLRTTLEQNRSIFTSDEPLVNKTDLWSKKAKNIFTYLGWFDDSLKNMIKLRLEKAIETYEDSVVLRTYIPNIKYVFATLMFDFSPEITVGLVNKVHNYLEQARARAEELRDANLAIYSITTCFSQLQDADSFIKCINRSIQAIETEFKEYFKYDDNYVIKRKYQSGMKLILLNIEDRAGCEPAFN